MQADATAGLTVAVMGVPQAMAYAMIAGLPPAYGLYTAIVTCAIAAITGSSRHLVTGPTNALCMVILSLTTHLARQFQINVLELVLLLTIMTGVIQIIFGLLKLGTVLRYVSNSVMVGFTAGAGILIAGNQLKNVMGVNLATDHVRFHDVLIATAQKIPEVNPYSLAIGVLTALCVILLPKINKKIPAALIGVLVSALIVYLMGWHDPGRINPDYKIKIVKDIRINTTPRAVEEKDPTVDAKGNAPHEAETDETTVPQALGMENSAEAQEGIPRSLNILRVPHLILHPDYEITRELGAGALALAILGLIEAASIARAIAASTGQRLNFNREFIGQGVANMTGGFFSSFAGSGSFTRSAVNFGAGARTRMAAVFSAMWTALTILLLAPAANYIPTASLAGMLIVIAYSMIEKHRLKLAWSSGFNSRLVLGSTLVSTLILPLEYAIFVGVIMSIVLLLKITGRTDLTQLIPRSDTGFDEVPFNRAAASPIVIVNMEGDLYFAAVEDLDYELQRSLTSMTRVVILRMKRLRAVGSTAMAILEHFWEILKARNITLIVCGIEEKLVDVMTHSGLRNEIGEQNIFYADNKLFQSTELAVARAVSVVEMERRREEAANLKEPIVQGKRGITAGEIMSRHCIRFGSQHQLREAIWLLSEMFKRQAGKQAQSLFLQDKEGRLAGRISPCELLIKLTESIDLDAAHRMDDHEFGEILGRNLTKSIEPMAEKGMDTIERDANMASLLRKTFLNDLRVLPVCDEGRRIIGLVGQGEVLNAIGDMLNLKHEFEPPLAGETPADESDKDIPF
ncbi:MAG: solute carrier family 23 protein [Candidatus Sumerlaeia bacterium]